MTTYFEGLPCSRCSTTRRKAHNGGCANCAEKRLRDREARAARPVEETREANRVAKWKERGTSSPTRPRPDNCECCGNPPPKNKPTLCLDHDHKTGKFRGWLCNNCNVGIGKLGDALKGVRRAAAYLRRSLNS